MSIPQLSERYVSAAEAKARLDEVKAAGFRAYIVLRPTEIVLHITDVKKLGWSYLPKKGGR